MPMPLLASLLAAAFALRASAVRPPVAPLRVVPVHYELDDTIDYGEGLVRGRATITVRNTSAEPVRELPLVLYRLMEVAGARAPGNRALHFTQEIVRDPDLPTLQLNQVRITLAAPLAPGRQTTVSVSYSGYLFGYAETGMRYIRDRIDPAFTLLRNDSWAFPIVMYASLASLRAAPPPSFDYRASITVPDTLVVANGGRLVERTASGGLATHTYRSILPSWRMDFAIGDYGELEAGRVRVLFLRRDSTGATRVGAAARAALDLFTSWFGAPPGDRRLTVIELEDGFGSQVDVTTVLQAAAAFRDSTRNYEIYHEISHLWNPPETDPPSPRWNEGLAQFLQVLARERLEGGPPLDADANAVLLWLERRIDANPRWSEVPMVDYGRAGMTDLSYHVGALFFHLLYRRIGPEAFNRAVGGFAQRYGTSGAGTADFMRYVEASAGVDLDPLFGDWLTSTRWVNRVKAAGAFPALLAAYGTDLPQ